MSGPIETLSVAVTANTGGLHRNLKKGEDSIRSFDKTAKSAGGGSGGGMFSLAGGMGMIGGAATAAVAGLAAVGAAGAGVVGLGVKMAADAEQAQVAFSVMLGSGEKAKQLMSDLQGFAASTPFEFPELRDATKKLLAFGVAQKDILPTLTSIGDIASGVGVPVSDLAEIFGKAKVQGKLMAEDVNQLTGRGIPVIQEFAKQFKVAESEVRNLVEKGQVNFSHLQNAFASLTSEGGKFAGLMEAQSGTIGGLWSTMTDTVGQGLTSLGQIIIDVFDLKDVAKNMIGHMETIKQFTIDALLLMQFGWNNWREILDLKVTQVELSLVTLGNVIHHTFTEVIPSILSWGIANWKEILTDYFNFTNTVFFNMSKNVMNAVTEIWDFISSAGTDSMDFTWTPLTDGFVSAIKELPKIAEREMGPLEKDLAKQVEAMGDKLTLGAGEFLLKRRKELGFDAAAGPAEDVGGLQVTDPIASGGKTAAAKKSADGGSGRVFTGVAALERGSAEAISAVRRAGSGKQPIDMVAKNTAEQVKLTRVLLGQLAKQKSTGIIVVDAPRV